jgi:hypothetical protein
VSRTFDLRTDTLTSPDAVSREFLASDAFRADMAGFAMSDIVEVATRILEAAPASPL